MCCAGQIGSGVWVRDRKELAGPEEGGGKERKSQCCVELPRKFTEKV